MNITYQPRRTGKTTSLIKKSAETGTYILVSDRNTALNLADQAREMGLNIPFPVTVQEYFSSGGFRGSFINHIFIDDADRVLQSMLSNVIIDEITLSPPEAL